MLCAAQKWNECSTNVTFSMDACLDGDSMECSYD